MKQDTIRPGLRLLATALVLMLTLSAFPVVMAAEAPDEASRFLAINNSKYDFSGTGTQDDPFLIETPEDLKRLRDSVNVGVTYNGRYFRQTRDITFPDGENWTPIGDVKKDYLFLGVYDGNGYTLNNIHSDHPFASVFAWLGGEVRNLGIESGSFSGSTVGSIASHGQEGARIINCYNKATVTATDRAGGITDNYGGQILFCWNLGQVTGLKDNTVTAGITSYSGYPNTKLSYAYSLGEQPVNPATYKGKLTGSRAITEAELGTVLKQNHQRMATFEDTDLISHRNLVFMTAQDGKLQFSREIPRDYLTVQLKGWIVPAFLGIVLLVLLVCTLIARPFRIPAPAAPTRRSAKAAEAAEEEPVDKTARRKVLAKRSIAAVLTLSLFAGMFACANGVLTEEFAAGNLSMTDYKNGDNPADVLLLGSSTMSTNIEVVDLWKDYGIASYCLASACASMQDVYYRLVDAENGHQPKLVVLDAKAVTHEGIYAEEEAMRKSIPSITPSLNKLRYITAAVPVEKRMDYLMNIPLYHSRYLSLTQEDFEHSSTFSTENKGHWTIFYGSTFQPELIDAGTVTGYRALNEKQEFYLREIISYCRKKGIEILLIKTPDANRTANQPYYNTLGLLAKEWGVPFLDMNLQDKKIGLVPEDFYYDNDHLNIEGARKCTALLGEYLQENYEIPDRRGDTAYDSWNRYSAMMDALYLMFITDKGDYFAELKKSGKKLIVIPYRTAQIKSKDFTAVMDSLDQIGYEIWDFPENAGMNAVQEYTLDENRYTVIRDYATCSIQLTGGKTQTLQTLSIKSSGILLVVYDEVLDEVVDVVGFAQGSGFKLNRLYWVR